MKLVCKLSSPVRGIEYRNGFAAISFCRNIKGDSDYDKSGARTHNAPIDISPGNKRSELIPDHGAAYKCRNESNGIIGPRLVDIFKCFRVRPHDTGNICERHP